MCLMLIYWSICIENRSVDIYYISRYERFYSSKTLSRQIQKLDNDARKWYRYWIPEDKWRRETEWHSYGYIENFIKYTLYIILVWVISYSHFLAILRVSVWFLSEEMSFVQNRDFRRWYCVLYIEDFVHDVQL